MMPIDPIKRFLPRTLFGRALLILILPTLLVQLLAIYQFYERHWDSVVRNMSNALAGEIELLVNQFDALPPKGRDALYEQARTMGIDIELDTAKQTVFVRGQGESDYPEFYMQLSKRLDMPFMVEQIGRNQDLRIAILLDEGTLNFYTSKKRLVSSTTYIFILWTMGSASILLFIATVFLRNQIRPIRQLAQAAEQFGLGQEVNAFRPRGASEIRQAGRAFLIMRNRIQRQVNSRTEMLAGISHDLRTPLTRMKLQLEMAEMDEKDMRALQSDIQEMEHMIQEYLDFARGEGNEETQIIAIDGLIEELVENYRRHDRPVRFQSGSGQSMPVRVNAMRRALQNVIDNALRYGEEAVIATQRDGAYLIVSIKDKGPGVPQGLHEEVFRPFTRLDPSRNSQTGGAGLGLSITRDIVQAHGGTIELRNRKKRGLEVVISLPMYEITQA